MTDGGAGQRVEDAPGNVRGAGTEQEAAGRMEALHDDAHRIGKGLPV